MPSFKKCLTAIDDLFTSKQLRTIIAEVRSLPTKRDMQMMCAIVAQDTRKVFQSTAKEGGGVGKTRTTDEWMQMIVNAFIDSELRVALAIGPMEFVEKAKESQEMTKAALEMRVPYVGYTYTRPVFDALIESCDTDDKVGAVLELNWSLSDDSLRLARSRPVCKRYANRLGELAV